MVARPKIAVLDYGMGNRRSVEKALDRAGARAVITRDHGEIEAADGLVVPGVGAFPQAMRNLRELELDAAIASRLADAVPVLGICLGMQLLFEASSENQGAWGLGLLQGRVDRLVAPNLKVPHIGWTPVTWRKRTALNEGLPDQCPFYIVHSLAAIPTSPEDVLGTALYGNAFVAAVEHENLYGVQFHPEKSSTHGIKLLENFTAICAAVGAEA
ncbi:MAG: imidazole glycerol phosphate synthase subunit HisH [Solirubrobacterales bacterium]